MINLPKTKRGTVPFWLSEALLVLVTLESLETLFGDWGFSVAVVVDLGGSE